MSLLLLFDASPPGADISFNGPMLALPYSLRRLGFTYTRNSLKTVYQSGQLLTLAANQFGTTYDAVTGLHAYEAEPAATNLALNSAGAAATWIVSNVTDAVTPITGFSNSLAFGGNSVLRYAYKTQDLTVAVTYTVSIFVQMDDGLAPVVGTSNTTGDFCIVSDGELHTASASIQRIAANLYRVSSARAATVGGAARNTGVVKYTTQSARTFRIIGIQVETGSRATSYIATAGATVTRAADALSTALTNVPGFNAAGYTLVVDGRMDVAAASNREMISINGGSEANRAFIRVNGATNTVLTFVSSGSVTQASTDETAVGVARFKAAYSVAANSFLRAVNGAAGTADTGGIVPASLTTLDVGHSNTVNQANGYIYGFKLIPVALNQAHTTAQTS